MSLGRSSRDALARRELPRELVPRPEALDEAPADRRGRAQRDLLRRDRDDERLERLRVQGRPEAGKRARHRAEDADPDRPRRGTRRGRTAARAGGRPRPRPRRSAARSRRRRPRPRSAPRCPSTTRCSPPSCQTVAPSEPKTRNRAIESSKSYGVGIRSNTSRNVPDTGCAASSPSTLGAVANERELGARSEDEHRVTPAERDDPGRVSVARDLLGQQAERRLMLERVRRACGAAPPRHRSVARRARARASR